MADNPQSMDMAKAKFTYLGFTIMTGTRHLGVHVGCESEMKIWVAVNVAK